MSARRLLARRRVVADDASKRMDRPILERCSMTTYAVLQKQPPEALDDRADEWRYGVVDVLSVGTQVGAETFLANYQRRHQAACRECGHGTPTNRGSGIRHSTASTMKSASA
jgi:hypothetical protein